MTDLAHLTIVSGHLSYIGRHEIGGSERAMAADLLARALASDIGTARLPAPWQDYALAVIPMGPALFAMVGVVDDAMQPTTLLLTMGVAPRDRAGVKLWDELHREGIGALFALDGHGRKHLPPPAPWCAVVPQLALADHKAVAPVLGDLEAAIAWAWIDRRATG